MFDSLGGASASGWLVFISRAAATSGKAKRYRLHKTNATFQGCRSVTQKDMVHDGYLPQMKIDAQTHSVRAYGQRLTGEAAQVLPMARRYLLF